MILEICPFCHRPFEAKAIAREAVDETDHKRIDPWGRGRLFPNASPTPEAVLTYNVKYNCKHCGKEWSKIETRKARVPVEYSETGFD